MHGFVGGRLLAIGGSRIGARLLRGSTMTIRQSHSKVHFRGPVLAAALIALVGVVSSANATVIVSIDDRTDSPTGSVTADSSNAIGSLAIVTTPEGAGVLGVVDPAFEYLSTDTANVPAPGNSFTLNYNIFEPNSTILSDTLSITVSGHTPAFTGDDNVSVDIHFRSDSTDEIPFTALQSASTIFETGGFQTVSSGLSDLTVKFASDVPEPASLGLFGSALIGMAVLGRRKRKST
jgi:PEP-CTERM motif